MTATQIKNLTLRDVIQKFGLVASQDRTFFSEWQQALPTLEPSDETALAQIEAEYFYLSQQPMAEGAVKMVVLSRLLSLAGFYRSPFTMTTEYTVKIQAIDDGKTLRGVIDILVLHEKLWALSAYQHAGREMKFMKPARFMVAANLRRTDRKSTRLNSSHLDLSRMPSSA